MRFYVLNNNNSLKCKQTSFCLYIHMWYLQYICFRVRVMMFSATFNNILVEVSFIGLGNRNAHRKPPSCRKSLTNIITKCFIECIPSWYGFQLTTLVVTGTDCIGCCKSTYNTITTALFMCFKITVHIYNYYLPRTNSL